MPRTERIVLWAILGLLIITNLGLLLEREPSALAASAADVIGPASAVTLEPADDDGVILTLRNEEDHLAWGTNPQQRAWSIGCVHVGPILTQLMDAEPLQEERQELADELQRVDEEFSATLEAISGELEGLDPDDEAAQEIFQRGQALYQEYQQFQQLGLARQQQQQGQHLETAYREFLSGVNVVADRLDLDIVFRFIPPDDEFSISTSDASLNQIRLRTLLRYPDACDITSDVLEELNLEDE